MAKARLESDGKLFWWCPGCLREHGVPIAGMDGHAVWEWNGNAEFPSLTPSVKVLPTLVHPLCHSIMTAGQLHFCADTSHKLAGRTVDMEELK